LQVLDNKTTIRRVQTWNHILLAPMMALSQPDPELGLPSGTTLIPRLFVRNAEPVSTQVSIEVNWRRKGEAGDFAIPKFGLAAGAVRVLALADYEKTGQIPADANWGIVKVAYPGRRADVIAVALSYDKTSRYGLQTPFSENLSRLWAGGMWHVDAMHNTLITTGNGGSEPTTAEITLFYNGGKGTYKVKKSLSPGQPLWLDVGQIIHNQVPDLDGHTLPPEAMAVPTNCVT
jgi:hypothetical protein